MPAPVTTARSTANGYHPIARTSFTNDSGSDLAELQSATAVSPSVVALAGGGNGKGDDGGNLEDEYGGYDGGADEETTPLQLLAREDTGEDEDEDEEEAGGTRAVEDEYVKTPADGGTILESFIGWWWRRRLSYARLGIARYISRADLVDLGQEFVVRKPLNKLLLWFVLLIFTLYTHFLQHPAAKYGKQHNWS
ncbi:hypothetical protein BC937DRAFT_93125, partial [Endogone sp. FLAS-F59071]